MPDTTTARQFRENLERALDGYSDALQGELDGTRARLAETLATAWPNRARVRQVAVREFQQLGERTARIGRDYVPRIMGAVESFIADQLEAVRSVMRGVVDMDAIRREMQTEARRVSAQILGDTPTWVTQLSTTFLTELARMQALGDEQQTMMNRLLAIDLVGGRASVVRSSGNSLALEADLDVWTLAMALAQGSFERAGRRSRVIFKKQAVAAIDHRTTDCCLRVHGQIQPMNSPFVLTGKPRFADRLQGPPFHWRCRTATTLYTGQMEAVGIPTSQMIEAAQAELRARLLTGGQQVIWPSHATSGRSQ